jgi:hypothetical protein
MTLIAGLMSAYWLWAEREGWQKKEHRVFLEKWLPRDVSSFYLWGEGSVYYSSTGISFRDEYYIAGLLRAVMVASSRVGSNLFPSPYWDFEECFKYRISNFLDIDSPLRSETTKHISYTATGLLRLLIRTNLKTECKILWPEYTKLICCHFEPEATWQYCLWRSEGGLEQQIMPELTKEWSDLVEEARDCRLRRVPASLAKLEPIFLLFVILFPHRATPEAISYLGLKFGSAWFIDPPIT